MGVMCADMGDHGIGPFVQGFKRQQLFAIRLLVLVPDIMRHMRRVHMHARRQFLHQSCIDHRLRIAACGPCGLDQHQIIG